MIAEEKKLLRSELSQLRSDIDLKTKRLCDEAICDQLKKLTLELSPEVVHAYIPMKEEIDTTPYISWCLQEGIRVICPKVLSGRKLAHLELLSLDQLEAGIFGTVHPSGNNIYEGSIDMILLPGLGFDKEMNRLGYGGGFYDRFLISHRKAKKIAALYPFQLVDRVPTEGHDEKMDVLVIP
ncbi:MAG: 5-formyltetrahydrofolate cyclo-ligase [Flavobacteriales bacterium]|jgi:5-formyltetrahydrofolate cyclo-ligase